MDKEHLRAAIIAELEAELATQTRAALDAHDEATSEESKPENKYDMHSQEAAYLAEGQARLAGEIARAIESYRALSLATSATHVETGSLVRLEDTATRRPIHYFIGPQRGGLTLTVAARDGRSVEITVLTPAAPLGRQLLGHTLGDEISLPGRRGKTAPARITQIS